MDFSLVEYEPTHLRFTGGNGPVSIDATIDFRDHDAHTHVTFDLETRPHGVFKVIMPLMAR